MRVCGPCKWDEGERRLSTFPDHSPWHLAWYNVIERHAILRSLDSWRICVFNLLIAIYCVLAGYAGILHTFVLSQPHKSFQSRKNYTPSPPNCWHREAKQDFERLMTCPFCYFWRQCSKHLMTRRSITTSTWSIWEYRVSSTGQGTILPAVPIDHNFLDYIWYAVLVIFYLTQLRNMWWHLSMLLDVILLRIFRCIFI